MAITLNTQNYEMDSWKDENRVQYRGPAVTDVVKDEITLSRTSPKPTADFAGVSRSSIKGVFTDVSTGKNLDLIITIEVSKPVGIPDAFVDERRDRMGDLFISAIGGLVVNKHDVTH